MDIVLVGSGGCMREIVWQIQEQNKTKNLWNILGYIDIKAPDNGEYIVVGKEKIQYLGTDEVLEGIPNANVVIAVGNPMLREKIADKLSKYKNVTFPNLILGNVHVCDDIILGKGCIVSMDCKVSTNVTLGDFVLVNIGTTICHDGRVGDFVTLSPGVILAGNVEVGKCSDIGMGTKIIQGMTIGNNVTTGAGSVVVKDIDCNTKVVGVPAKKI